MLYARLSGNCINFCSHSLSLSLCLSFDFALPFGLALLVLVVADSAFSDIVRPAQIAHLIRTNLVQHSLEC